MTSQSTSTSPRADEARVEQTRWRLSAWALFAAVITLVLALDLGLKAWSFEHVADTPIRVRQAESGGPEVMIPGLEEGQWVSAYELGLTPERRTVPQHEPTVVIPGLLNLQLTLNTGAVFGTGQGGRPIFITVSVVAVGVILLLMYRSAVQARLYHVALALILGGAMGNLYDRIQFAAVRDMLHMLPQTKLWPWIFNPADVALVFGVGLVLLVSWLTDAKGRKQAKD